MVAKKNIAAILAIVAVGSALLLIKEITTNRQISRYNAAIADKNYARAETWLGDLGIFAKAYADHQQGDFPSARAGYNDLRNSTINGMPSLSS